jgi:hypothetical protein
MLILLDIPEAEYKRYDQYYKPWEVKPKPEEGQQKESANAGNAVLLRV